MDFLLYEVLWLGIALLSLLIELALNNFIFAWVSSSALITLICGLQWPLFKAQLIIFTAATLIQLLVVRKKYLRHLSHFQQETKGNG